MENEHSKEAVCYGLLEEVCKREEVELKELGREYRQFFIPLNTRSSDRCIDGRKCDDPNYNGGPQYPAGSAGVLDATRKVYQLSETNGRNLVLRTYNENGLILGMHTDDAHGDSGCANQQAVISGKLGDAVEKSTEDEVMGRIEWVKQNGGVVPTLTGRHQEKLTIVNLNRGKTFDTNNALKEHASAFSFDLRHFFTVASLIASNERMMASYDPSKLQEIPEFTKSEELIMALTTNYIRTVKAVSPRMKTIYYLV